MGERTAARARRVLPVLFLVLLADLVSFTCILPLFPALFEHYAQQRDPLYSLLEAGSSRLQALLGSPGSGRHSAVFLAGVVGSLFSLLQYLSSPLLGALSDVHGRRPVFVCSVLGSLLSYWVRCGL